MYNLYESQNSIKLANPHRRKVESKSPEISIINRGQYVVSGVGAGGKEAADPSKSLHYEEDGLQRKFIPFAY